MAHPWKFLVYIAADNSLYDAAQMSLREITEATQFSDIETIVQIDGPTSDLATRYRCSEERENSSGKQKTGSPMTEKRGSRDS